MNVKRKDKQSNSYQLPYFRYTRNSKLRFWVNY